MPAETLTEYATVLRDPQADRDVVLRSIVSLAGGDDALLGYTEDQLYEALLAREDLGSTGFGDGIAIPHCHLPGLAKFVVGIVAVPAGATFDAVDGEPIRLAFFIFAPAERRNEHVSLLASVSRLFASKKAVAALSSCETDEDLLTSLGKVWTPPRNSAPDKGRSLLQVFVQREELMEPVLEALSENVFGEISIVEGRSARAYLHRLPLFSGFWTDMDPGFLRTTTAFADSSKCNDIARRLMLISRDEPCPGVLAIAQDIRCAVGRLEF